MRVLPYGDRAALIETDRVLAVRDRLVGQHGVVEVVPAARTVLVELDPVVLPVGRLADLLSGDAAAGTDRPPPDQPLRLPVRYDGPDLASSAELAGLTVDELVALHSGAEYTVRFCGFSPGFGYLDGLPDQLRLSRLASPRSAVPAGSVAVADEFTGVYPRASPGGWRLLGRTDAELFDLRRDPPALLTPGRRVRFIPR